MLSETWADNPFDEESLGVAGVAADSTAPDGRFRLVPGAVALGTIGSLDFVDWWALELREGVRYAVTLDAGPDAGWYSDATATGFRFFLAPAGGDDQLGSRAGSDAHEQTLAFTSSVSGTYHLRIASDGPRFDYGITLTESDPTTLVAGGDGDDAFRDREGDERFVGGDGMDSLIFEGVRSAFRVAVGSAGVTVRHGGETDTASGVERLAFDDGSLLFSAADGHLDDVFRLYTAAFGRVPDAAGLTFWTAAVEGGDATLGELAALFVGSGEFRAAFGADPGESAFIDALYGNVLGRDADADGRTFWTGMFRSGELDRAGMLLAFAESAENAALVPIDPVQGIWLA